MRQAVAQNPALQRELDELRRTRALLQETVETSAEGVHNPFLVERIVDRMAQRTTSSAGPLEEVAAQLSRLFRPVAAAYWRCHRCMPPRFTIWT